MRLAIHMLLPIGNGICSTTGLTLGNHGVGIIEHWISCLEPIGGGFVADPN